MNTQLNLHPSAVQADAVPQVARARVALGLGAVVWFLAVTSAYPAEVQLNGHSFTLPDGFAIEAVAGPPLVDRPIVADFDERGRLYVADSSGSNEPVKTQLEKKPHRIVRLEDTNGDGRFDKSVVFADKMMFPEGTMWYDGSLYVTAPPSIWKLTDTDGDGVADKREEWLDAKTLTGCANDLHGPYLGLDGWIYWCKGAFAEQHYERPDGSTFTTRAAHIFRRKAQGGFVEAVMTGGMDNPVDVVFTPEGERIFTTTFFQHPGGGQRDGLIHAVYGGIYGKVHNVLDDHKRTGDVMPVLTHLGPAAPCGLTRYESDVFGRDYQNSLFACAFNLHKVTRHVLQPKGASFQTENHDFLVSNNVDFHPTDVLEDADGSLVVVDTGGWYKICCPTSQLYKPDVLGAIYRIRRVQGQPLKDGRGSGIDWAGGSPDALLTLLNDSRPAVVRRAVQTLASRGKDAVPPLAKFLHSKNNPAALRQALWCLARIDDSRAREAARIGLKNSSESVVLTAIHGASLHRDAAALPDLLELLTRHSAPVQRAAAEAIGRIGNPSAVGSLLQVAGAVKDDRFLEHSITFALIEIANANATSVGLSAASAATQRAALIALDQMTGGGLKPDRVAPLLVSADPILKKTAAWIVGRHPDWAGSLAKFFEDRLAKENLSDAERTELENQLSLMARDAAMQQLLASQAGNASAALPVRLSALRAMSRAGLKELPALWESTLAALLQTEDPGLTAQAVATARSMPAAKGDHAALRQGLLRVAGLPSLSVETRLKAMAAMPGGLDPVDAPWFALLQEQVLPDRSVTIRTTAAEVLARAALNREQMQALTQTISLVGSLELPKLVEAYSKCSDEALGMGLVAALDRSAARSALRAEWLNPNLKQFPDPVRTKAQALLDSLHADAGKQKAHLDSMLAQMQDGDVRRGQAVFNSAKAACASCHAIGYLGGNIGPDLTKIGQVRTERDLIEAMVYPSASFVRSYEPVVIATKSGDDFSGVVRQDAPEEVVLATGPGVEVHIARADIVSMRPGTVSIMPDGLGEQLSRQELADLLAFLKATKW